MGQQVIETRQARKQGKRGNKAMQRPGLTKRERKAMNANKRRLIEEAKAVAKTWGNKSPTTDRLNAVSDMGLRGK